MNKNFNFKESKIYNLFGNFLINDTSIYFLTRTLVSFSTLILDDFL